MDNNIRDLSIENKIQVSFKKTENSRKEKTLQTLGDIFVSGLLHLAFIFTLISMFKIQGLSAMTIFLGSILIFALSCFFDNIKGIWKILIIIALFIMIISGNVYIKNGLLLTINQAISVIGKNTGLFIKEYKITIGPEMYKISINYFWSMFSLIIAFVCFMTVRNRSNLFLWIFVTPIFLLETWSGITPGFFHNLILFLASILLVNNSFIKGSNENKLFGRSKDSIILYTAFIILSLFIVFSFGLNKFKPASSYSKNSIAKDIKNTVADKIEDFRYEKKKTNTFTQGNFRKLEKLELLDIPALKITMDKPTSLYLRGYVGSKYTSESWTDLDDNIYYDSYGLFYWLNKSEFSGFSQLSTVNNLVKGSKNKDEKTNITINNINANSKYLYIPYESDIELDSFKNIKTFADSKVMSTSFWGNRFYKYKANTNLVKKYPEIASNLYDLKNKPEVKEYLKHESHYNEFIYENYTKIPRDIESLMENQLGEVSETEDTHMPYEKAIEIVKSYLDENIVYTVEPKSAPKGKDFLRYFLEESREGYATHYATAATAMFRYLGIPSRYVEGYLITPKDVKNVSDSKPIVIKGTNAHAWTEIYIDEIGWIPIEVTPPYYDVMEQTDTSEYPGGANLEKDKETNSSGNSSQGKQQIVDDEQEPNNNPNNKPSRKLTTLEKVIFTIGLIILLTILIYIVYVIRKRKELKEMKKGFEDPNYKLAIPRIFSYSMSLIHYGGLSKRGGSTYGYLKDIEKNYSKKHAKIFEKAIKINQEAVFSNHEISEEQYNYMIRFMDQILYDIVESKNILQRMKMKFWDFIY
ncbi:transglutaminase domain-containing protein [Anaerosalibacter bizertensis]|uniref:Transglutaminase domain-containing protein n=1 Tax=Anaerosalibacter bizertensis TaxID=932217 RepID=A0A844FEY5_9FIRM|nr:transglutaminase-like domain-containing protein [Anaerosalibacter bizertensis]MBU5294571.1 transglutaminase-like domain-containing protein [Anaerosalibacter bizertensis]MSS42563.1 transglutaminase domain-containing protein [Anaerosalibacter bizertensis]